MNIKQKGFSLKEIVDVNSKHRVDKKKTGEARLGTCVGTSDSGVQALSEKLFLLGERSPNYVLGYN